jgi:hypothetical protein
MQPLAQTGVLALWERGAKRHALDRTALLCAWARPDLPADSIADLPLGTVTADLLRLREASFGPRIDSRVACVHCGAALELSLACSELLQPGVVEAEVAVAGLRLRAPSLRDLAAVADERDADRAARRILARCMLKSEADTDPELLDDALLRACEDALDTLDPNADIALRLHCEACGEHGSAQLDIGVLLWEEIETQARQLLQDVHALARAYGWTEGDILSLSPARRESYLAMVGAR